MLATLVLVIRGLCTPASGNDLDPILRKYRIGSDYRQVVGCGNNHPVARIGVNSRQCSRDVLPCWPFHTEHVLYSLRSGIWVVDGTYYKQHLNNLRRKDSLRRAETTGVSVRPRYYSASHFEGSAYTGGHTTMDGVEGNDVQNNWRVGLTVALPVNRHNSLIEFNPALLVIAGHLTLSEFFVYIVVILRRKMTVW